MWCDTSFERQTRTIVAQNSQGQIPVSTIVAGKLRRYHHLTLLQHVLIPSVLFPNILDGFKVIIGTIQAFCKLIAWRPDVIFTKGGFVCLPVGWAARLLRIPVVIHDSDAHPGLTNRLLAPHAAAIATGAPLKYYNYPAHKSTYVGIPIGAEFTPYSPAQQRAAKKAQGFDPNLPLVVVTGGGLGAKRINDATAHELATLTKHASVLLISGALQYDSLRAQVGQDTERFQLRSFVSSGMAPVFGAADIVVARAGATSILELAAMAMPTILVPNGRLTGGHQLKNAKVYEDAQAAMVIDEVAFEKQPKLYSQAIISLLANPAQRKQFSRNIKAFARPQAARDVADIILAIYKKRKTS